MIQARFCRNCGKEDLTAQGKVAPVFALPGICMDCRQLGVIGYHYDMFTGQILQPTHDGQLNEEDTHHVYHNNFKGIAISANGQPTWMSAKEALSLLAWLTQERETLERLAKEQEGV